MKLELQPFDANFTLQHTNQTKEMGDKWIFKAKLITNVFFVFWLFVLNVFLHEGLTRDVLVGQSQNLVIAGEEEKLQKLNKVLYAVIQGVMQGVFEKSDLSRMRYNLGVEVIQNEEGVTGKDPKRIYWKKFSRDIRKAMDSNGYTFCSVGGAVLRASRNQSVLTLNRTGMKSKASIRGGIGIHNHILYDGSNQVNGIFHLLMKLTKERGFSSDAAANIVKQEFTTAAYGIKNVWLRRFQELMGLKGSVVGGTKTHGDSENIDFSFLFLRNLTCIRSCGAQNKHHIKSNGAGWLVERIPGCSCP
ncbi:unnamed protein product [Linum tenue]|uniref:Uncharacterized protein n=1 Tax=Linum tenue TaxID=586396 RepID=A0AAV0R4E5_9ROSI|nr:unnamed protein product [Linum tenue]